jgi:hypothetical protein
MMMEPAPSAPFVMTETDLLLEFLIIALDAPPQLCGVDRSPADVISWMESEAASLWPALLGSLEHLTKRLNR